MLPNPFDPRDRTDLSPREKLALEFTGRVLHGGEADLIDQFVSPHYVQHTPGIGQGPDGLHRFVTSVASRRAGATIWRPIHLFECGDFVILHKLLPAVVIADFFRFDVDDKLAEHWDVVQPLPAPDYDPMRLSTENFDRFLAFYGLVPLLTVDDTEPSSNIEALAADNAGARKQ